MSGLILHMQKQSGFLTLCTIEGMCLPVYCNPDVSYGKYMTHHEKENQAMMTTDCFRPDCTNIPLENSILNSQMIKKV